VVLKQEDPWTTLWKQLVYPLSPNMVPVPLSSGLGTCSQYPCCKAENWAISRALTQLPHRGPQPLGLLGFAPVVCEGVRVCPCVYVHDCGMCLCVSFHVVLWWTHPCTSASLLGLGVGFCHQGAGRHTPRYAYAMHGLMLWY